MDNDELENSVYVTIDNSCGLDYSGFKPITNI